MISTMTLLKHLNNPNFLLPYKQYYIQSLLHEGKLIPEQSPGETNPLFQTAINPNPHIPHKQTSSASACKRIPHHPAEPHNNTNTHRTRYAITHRHDIRIYSGNIIKNTLHTRELTNMCNNQYLLKHASKTITHVTTNHSPQNKDTNAKTSILTEQYNTWNKSTASCKLLKMDVLTFKTCWAVNSEIIKQVTSSWSIYIQLSRWCTVQ
jgi:hypothetical protein